MGKINSTAIRLLSVGLVLIPLTSHAALTSTNFKLRVTVNAAGGDSTSSANFKMLGSAAQSSTDTTASASFISKNGFIYNLRFDDDTVAVASPNGGETLAVGSVRNILWSTVPGIGNVKIEFSADSGSTFPNLIAYTANNGSYSWAVPDSIGANIRVRISDSANANVFDASDANFRIAGAFTLLTPNGGEVWNVGDALGYELLRRPTSDFAISKRDRAFRRPQYPDDRLDQSRLARPVRSDDRHHFPGVDDR